MCSDVGNDVDRGQSMSSLEAGGPGDGPKLLRKHLSLQTLLLSTQLMSLIATEINFKYFIIKLTFIIIIISFMSLVSGYTDIQGCFLHQLLTSLISSLPKTPHDVSEDSSGLNRCVTEYMLYEWDAG